MIFKIIKFNNIWMFITYLFVPTIYKIQQYLDVYQFSVCCPQILKSHPRKDIDIDKSTTNPWIAAGVGLIPGMGVSQCKLLGVPVGLVTIPKVKQVGTGTLLDVHNGQL